MQFCREQEREVTVKDLLNEDTHEKERGNAKNGISCLREDNLLKRFKYERSS